MPNPAGTFTIDGSTPREWRGIAQGVELFTTLIGEGNIPYTRDAAGILTIQPTFDPAAKIVFLPVKSICFHTAKAQAETVERA
jgi:hypothetical protein